MGRPKKQVVMKEPIRLREQVLKNGNRSLYLDIYHNGKRTYNFLKLYLVPETDMSSKIMNANTLAQANAIKEEMILDLTNRIAGIKDKSHKARMPFCSWMVIYAENAKKSCAESSKRWLDRSVEEVASYDSEITLGDVDKEFITGFIEHLASRSALNTDRKKITKSTVFLYLCYVRAALNYAVRESVIPKSPFKGITRSSLSIKEHKREYLTVEEIKRLIATPCHREDIKGAFLFSCFSGLRIYDIMSLHWKDIVKTATHWQVEIIQYKTGVELFLPLNMNARKWLPERQNATARTTGECHGGRQGGPPAYKKIRSDPRHMDEERRNHKGHHFSRGEAQLCNTLSYCGYRYLHDQPAARAHHHPPHPALCPDYQHKERRGGFFVRWRI